MEELLITIIIWIAIISGFIKIFGLLFDSIGNKVFKHNMEEDIKARESAYISSFNSYMSELKAYEKAGASNGVTGWISRHQYQEYLESAEWRSKADHRLAIDGYRCQYCDSEVKSRINDRHKPNIHHFHYHNIMHENVYDDLITLCQVCHTNLHKDYSIKDMEVEIKTHGFAYK